MLVYEKDGLVEVWVAVQEKYCKLSKNSPIASTWSVFLRGSNNLILDGYEVVSTYTCSEAKRLMKHNYYNLLLLDINQPDGNSLALCTEIKERSPETYIMFLATNDKERDMRKGYDVGGSDYITKPFAVAVLCNKIAAVFETMEYIESKSASNPLRLDITFKMYKIVSATYPLGRV